MDNYADTDLWFTPSHPSPGNPNADHTRAYTRQYKYDKLGNIGELKALGTGGFTRTFNYPLTGSIKDHNKQSSIDIGANSYDFTYDAQGNLTASSGNRHYVWNYLGQLVAFYIQDGTNEPTTYAQYLYDPSGVRIKKIVRSAGGGYKSIEYIDGVFEFRTDGLLEQNTIHIMDNATRVANVVIGDAFPGDIAQTSWYVVSDHLGCGTLRLSTAAGGTLIDREEYYPFGDSSLRTFSKKRYRYVGKERDSESGLYYYGARYYAAWTGRFVSVDPLAMKYNQLTPYNYAGNDPIGDYDIDGQQGAGTAEAGVSSNGSAQEASAAKATAMEAMKTNPQIKIHEIHNADGTNILAITRPEGEGEKTTFYYWNTPENNADSISPMPIFEPEPIASDATGIAEPTIKMPEAPAEKRAQEDREFFAASQNLGFIDYPSTDVRSKNFQHSPAKAYEDAVNLGTDIAGMVAGGLKFLATKAEALKSVFAAIKSLFRKSDEVAERASNLTKSQLKSISSLEKQIATHTEKLKAYKADPWKFDNKGLLKNAPNDSVRQRIIQSRINHLEKEIQTFQNNIQKILKGQ